MMYPNVDRTLSRVALRRFVLSGVLIALCAVGASISIPGGPLGTPAFDSAPGYFAGFTLGGGLGALVAAIGNLLTVILHGFPFTLPVQLLIAAEMAGVVAVAAWTKRRFGWIAGLIWSLIGNGVLAPLFLIWLPGFGLGFYLGSLVQLLVATLLNAGLAVVVGRLLEGRGALSAFQFRK